MRPWLICLFAVVLAPGCDDSRTPSSLLPSAPTSTVSPAAGPAPSLSGIVRAAGRPLAGATVALLTFDAGALTASTVTGGDGSYSLPDVRNVSPYSGALVSVSKPGFFTDTRYVLVTRDQNLDVELQAAEAIAVGEVVESAVGVDARCASLGYGGGSGAACRRFALTVPRSGQLEVTVSSTPSAPFDGTVLRPDGSIGFYVAAPLSPMRLTLRVEAGLTYQIDVVHINPDTREFELKTSLP